MSKYLLIYHKDLAKSPNLIEGRLLLIDTQASTIVDTYIATSGTVRAQSFDDQDIRGRGAIPRQDLVDIPHYTVQTTPIPMSNVKGVNGNFYKIDPHEVLINGKKRGDFGIHRDANVPGSAGCIVLTTQQGWSAFESRMQAIQKEVNTIPLLVSYVR